MTHYDNSGSEDGQLRSPVDDQFISNDDDDELDDHDADSLDIKPPQATAHLSRDATARDSRRHDKYNKEKKHSKERGQRSDRSGGGGIGGGTNTIGTLDVRHDREREREHRSSGGNTASFRDGRAEMERFQRGNYERNDGGGVGGGGRYQKHYERGRDNHALMQQQQHHHQTTHMHLHRRQGDYFERQNNYHHNHHHQQLQQQHQHHHPHQYHHQDNDYQSMRQSYGNNNSNNKYHANHSDYGSGGHHDLDAASRDRDRERERRKYPSYDSGHHQDAESLEQDLRSRLLSKRHKYVKDYEPVDTVPSTTAAVAYESRDKKERNYAESQKEHQSKSRRDKELRNSNNNNNNVIEVFDSPDIRSEFNKQDRAATIHRKQQQQKEQQEQEQHEQQQQLHSKKHKRREKEQEQWQEAGTAVSENRRSPEDEELVKRRAKLLVTEREITKRKEAAREELEARRREKRREREHIDELSPTAVAANVTAGLNLMVMKRHKNSTEKHKKAKKAKHQRVADVNYEDEEAHHESVDSDDSDVEHSETESEKKVVSVERKRRRKRSLKMTTTTHGKRKKLKSSKRVSIDRQRGLTDDNDNDDDDERDIVKNKTNIADSESDAADSVHSHKQTKSKRKHSKKSANKEKRHRRNKHTNAIREPFGVVADDDDDNDDDDDDGDDVDEEEIEEEVLQLITDSPLSIGDLSKSPDKRHRKSSNSNDERSRSCSPTDSRYHTRSPTRSSTPSYSHSRSSSNGHQRSLSTSRSRSQSPSRTASDTYSPRSRSSRSRSRSRSEERDMQANLTRSNAEQKHFSEMDKRIAVSSCAESGGVHPETPTAPCDDKGVALPNYYPGLQGCRSVEEFQCLNRIEEGTYGVVYRAKDKRTNEIVALKRLKMEKEKEGFPITSLREINTLLKGQHPNIVTVREIVVGSNMDKIFIVMDYVEHDLKSLMETMKARKQSFLPAEVKCLTQQLLLAVGHLHDNWILHRDLKTSNLLLSHKGILKVGDFGLAREYGSPLKKYTSLVVTLWYRAPELLLCAPEYSTPIDIWSVGCIFAEFLQMAPLFPGKSEIDELNRIFKELGTPNDKIWPGYKDLPAVKNLISPNSQFADYPSSNLRKRFKERTTDLGISFLQGLLTYDPKQRLNADTALKHAYFKELPLPIEPAMFPTWPAKSELGARRALVSSPKPPSGGSQFKQLGRDELLTNAAAVAAAAVAKNKINVASALSGIITGNKKMAAAAANTGFVLNAGIEQRQLAMGPGFNLKF